MTLITKDDTEIILQIFQRDDDIELQDILMRYGDYNPILSEPNADYPKRIRKCKYACNAAALYGASNCLRFIIQNRKVVSTVDDQGRSLAHYSIYSGRIDIISLIIEHGYDIDCPSNNGLRPIHLASKLGQLSLCKFFWANGINMSTKDNLGYEPIHYAALYEHFDLLEFFIEIGISISEPLGNKSTLYIMAIRKNRFSLLSYLVDHQIPQIQSESGLYPIHEAVSLKQTETVQFLLDNGADSCVQNKQGDTPLHLAVFTGYESIVMSLILNGGVYLMNIENNKKRTALHNAAKCGNYSFVSLLLQNGAQCDVIDQYGLTAMNIAYTKKHHTIVELFSSYGMNNHNISIDNPKITRRKSAPKWGFKSKKNDIDYDW